MNQTWHFGEQKFGEKEGFNASGISMFAGDTVESLTREVIQNSLDARDDGKSPVRITFDLLHLNPIIAPEVYALRDWINLGHEAEALQEMNSQVGVDFYKAAKSYLDSEAGIKVLAIHDANTIGLGGPLRTSKDTRDGGWISLVTSAGVTKKQGDDALGSFGQGAKAPFAISGLRTVFYLTNTCQDTPQQMRFQGKSILQSMWLTNDTHTGKTGFFGKQDANSQITALVNHEIPSWASNSRAAHTSENGTSLFVVAPRESEKEGDFWFKVKVTVLANFYFAVSEGNLEVKFGDGDYLDSANLHEVFQTTVEKNQIKLKLFSEKVQDALESSMTIQVGLLTEDGHGAIDVAGFGEVKWFLRLGDGTMRRTVGIARQNGMLITRRPPKLQRFPSFRPFDLFLCVTGPEGSTILRSFENPQHNDFEWDRVVDPKVRLASLKAYEKFADSVRDFLGTKVAAEIKESVSTNDLNHLFGGTPDLQSGEDPDEASNRLSISKAEKRKVVAGEKTLVPSAELGAAGGLAGGPGENDEPGGTYPNPSGADQVPLPAYKGRQVENLRISPVDSQGFSQVNFTPTQSGVSVLRLFRSGTVERTPVEVQLPGSSAWVTTLQVPSASTGRRKNLKLKFHPEDLFYSLEAILSNGN
jgi:hypothetical protein